ncbi:MAG TPA: inositol monophosphatase family protein [Nitrospiraceae bacterium]|nr:inositol monophosphatase family protein [Nitrospiraceae bacterium]
MLQSQTGQLPDRPTRERIKTVAIDAARQAGAILTQYAKNGFRVEHKDALNLVTDADTHSEQAVVDAIGRTFPDHEILAEERGQAGNKSAFKWIIDPLDGTTNFAHGFPAYAVSIGVEYQGRCILGVVFDPTRQELFVGEAGGGATLNGKPIRVSPTPKLDGALLVTGFAYDIRVSKQNNLDHFANFALRAQGMRRMGAAAIDLCYVACGRFDGFWELKLNPWDTAAGSLMVAEAGGRMSDFRGEPFSIYGIELVASNGLIHHEMVEVLNRPSV